MAGEPARLRHIDGGGSDGRYATRGELEDVRRTLTDMHAGLFGTRDVPGGKLGAIEHQIAAMAETITARVLGIMEKREREAREARVNNRRAFAWDVTKVLVAAAAVIWAAYITVHH